MPFQSSKQRAYFYSQLPELAKKWESETPKKKKLPEYKDSPNSIHSYLKKQKA
jgi:hypothetical protein